MGILWFKKHIHFWAGEITKFDFRFLAEFFVIYFYFIENSITTNIISFVLSDLMKDKTGNLERKPNRILLLKIGYFLFDLDVLKPYIWFICKSRF